jgi:hypothetical protein
MANIIPGSCIEDLPRWKYDIISPTAVFDIYHHQGFMSKAQGFTQHDGTGNEKVFSPEAFVRSLPVSF